MPRGGRRPGAGRRKVKVELGAKKNLATHVLALTQKPIHQEDCGCEDCAWWGLLNSPDEKVRLETRKYLTDKRDGKPVSTVNHIHDKPIEMNVNLSMAEIVRKVRERKADYERSRA